MSEKVISDAGAGRALFLTRMKLTIHAVSMLLWAGAIPGLIVPIVLWMSCLSPRDVDIVKLNIVSHLVKQETPRKWRIRDEAGQDQNLTVVKSNGDEVQLLTAAQYRTVTASLSRPVTVFGYVMLASLLCGLLGYLSGGRLAVLASVPARTSVSTGLRNWSSRKSFRALLKKRKPVLTQNTGCRAS